MTHRFQIKFVCIESIHCFDWFDSIAKKGWNKYSRCMYSAYQVT